MSMAPRTRNKQRKERRKWMRNQHRLQQESHQGRDLPPHTISSGNISTTTEDNRLSNGTNPEAENEIFDREMSVSVASKFGELILEENNAKNINKNEQNTNQDKGGHRHLHPPDCLCIIRKLSHGKNFFPSSLFLSPEMTEHSDSIYCLEISPGGV